MVVAALLAGSPASAQAPRAAGDVAAAAQAFHRGVALLDARRYPEAIAAFERSLSIREGAAALYDLGLALRASRRPAEAIRAFERFLAVARPTNPARAGATAMLAELRRRVARLSLTVQGGASAVLLDGRPIADGDGVYERDLDPGPHAVEARREGFAPARLDETLAPGESTTLSLDASARPLPSRPARAAPSAASLAAPVRRPVDPRASATPHRPLYANGWFWVGVGAAAAIAAAITVGVVMRDDPTPDGGSFGQVFHGLTLSP